jgi:hypothetical protein
MAKKSAVREIVLTTTEVASRLGVHRQTVLRFLRRHVEFGVITSVGYLLVFEREMEALRRAMRL